MLPKKKIFRNTLANYFGMIVQILVPLVCLPIYNSYFNEQEYGLILFFTTLQAVFAVFDMGLSKAVEKEIGNFKNGICLEKAKLSIRIASFERIFWGVLILLGLCVLLLEGPIVKNWIIADKIPIDVLSTCYFFAATNILVRLFTTFQTAVIRGFEAQVSQNTVTSIGMVSKNIIAIGYLHYCSVSIIAYFFIILMVHVLEVLVFQYIINLEKKKFSIFGNTFSYSEIAPLFKYCFGLIGITVLGILLKYADKLMVSKMLSIELLGYYGTAAMVGQALSGIAGPIQKAIFPQICANFTNNDQDAIISIFANAVEKILIIASPFCVFTFMNSFVVLMTWTGDNELSKNATGPLQLICFASLLNLVASIPFTMQLGQGKTRVSVIFGSVACIFVLPLNYIAIAKYGINGAAIGWVLYNVAYAFLFPAIILRDFKNGVLTKWLYIKFIKTTLYSFIACWCTKEVFLKHGSCSLISILLILGATYIILYTIIKIESKLKNKLCLK